MPKFELIVRQPALSRGGKSSENKNQVKVLFLNPYKQM